MTAKVLVLMLAFVAAASAAAAEETNNAGEELPIDPCSPECSYESEPYDVTADEETPLEVTSHAGGLPDENTDTATKGDDEAAKAIPAPAVAIGIVVLGAAAVLVAARRK